MTLQTFGKERSQRYNTALKYCPYARMNELIPLLLFLYREDLDRCTLVDLASGTGYLPDLLRPFVKRIVRVDKSPEMLALAQEDANIIYTDLKNAYATLADTLQADIITCLAALHHVCEMQDGQVEPVLSDRTQHQVIQESAKLLASGGKLLFVDVGIPESPLSEQVESFSQKMERYYQDRQACFRQRQLRINPSFWSALAKHAPDYLVDGHLPGWLRDDTGTTSLAHIIEDQQLSHLSEQTTTLVVDFFNDVVANHSIDGHIAHFPQEQRLRVMLEESGLCNIFIACLPTVWKFRSESEAVWFVRELFSLGAHAMQEPCDLVQQPAEYQRIKQFIDQYLGMHTDNNITYINWQLVFAYGER